MSGPVEYLGGLYGPTTEQQATTLPDIGNGLSAQLESLSRDPTPWACEVMAANLEGARRAVLRLRESLMREQTPDSAA